MTTNSFRVSAEASGDVLSDSGIGDTTKAEATGRHGKQQFLPHGGEAAATKPPGFWVSQTVVVVEEEQDDCENNVPALESWQWSRVMPFQVLQADLMRLCLCFLQGRK